MNKDIFKYDLPASVVVFLVALPLCLGIALASGAPLVSGLIAGVVGGIVVGSLSGSSLSVSGPAAGLATVVLAGISDVGSWPAFLFCVVVAGILQVILGYIRAGAIGHFFPASVIRGMLASIGLILILKQIPHALGYDADFEGDESFSQHDGLNTFSELWQATHQLTAGAIVVSIVSLAVMIIWSSKSLQKHRFFEMIPSSVVVVMFGVILNELFNRYSPALEILPSQMVNIPKILQAGNWQDVLTLPDFSMWRDPKIYTIGATVAAVASIETLLNIEASDKFDPYHRITPPNRELRAQGVGNIVSGLLGGLPITSVIVRSSTNTIAGARTKASSIIHGIILLIAVAAIPSALGRIPLACLAALLLFFGYRLTQWSIFKEMHRKGIAQFLPFIVTIIAVLLTNLLLGVFCGILVAIFFILKTNFQKTVILVGTGNRYLLTLTKDVSFLSKATLRDAFYRIPKNSELRIDGGHAHFLDDDIKETISDFMESSRQRNITVELKNIIL